MTEPDPLTRALTDAWDADAGTYDKLPRHGLLHDDERRAWRRLVAAILGDPGHSQMSPLRVLDVGTGTGMLALVAAELGHDVTGLDLSTRMLAEARRKALDAGLAVRFVEGDASEPPVEPGTVDAVISRHLVWTLPDPARALRAWCIVVRPGGLVAVIDGSFPHRPAPVALAGRAAEAILARRDRRLDGAHQRPYSPEVLARLPLARQNGTGLIASVMRDAGLHDVRVRRLTEIDRVERGHRGMLERLADPWSRYLATGRSARS